MNIKIIKYIHKYINLKLDRCVKKNDFFFHPYSIANNNHTIPLICRQKKINITQQNNNYFNKIYNCIICYQSNKQNINKKLNKNNSFISNILS